MKNKDREQTPPSEVCATVAQLLDDFVDGLLEDLQTREVAEHLGRCVGCGEEKDSLEQVLAAAEALPAHLDPPRDLWPEIDARLIGRESHRRPVLGYPGSWLTAVAALLLVALGFVLGLGLRPSPAPGPSAYFDSAGTDLRPAAAEDGFQTAESDLLRAKEGLRLLAASKGSGVSATTRKIIRRNLLIIDEAIGELRRALEEDPGNPRLRQQLLAHHRREIDLLRRLSGSGGGLT